MSSLFLSYFHVFSGNAELPKSLKLDLCGLKPSQVVCLSSWTSEKGTRPTGGHRGCPQVTGGYPMVPAVQLFKLDNPHSISSLKIMHSVEV